MVKVVKLFSLCPLKVICPCVWLYTCIKLCYFLNIFFYEIARAIFTRFHMAPSIERVLPICLNDSVPLNKVAAMPIYGKTLKTLLLQNQEIFEAESWYISSETQDLPSVFKGWS